MTSGAGDPYLSLVVTARNDDHGGNLLGRMQAFYNGWIAQARRFQIPSELIIVEWNPPPDRPRLAQALQCPKDFGPCEVRFIEVPNELHRHFAHADALPLYQMIAKNAGIRRSRGQFVLVTNIDILFSDELAAHLAERRLQTGRMYRIDRHDVMSDVPVHAPMEEQLDYCRSHLIRVNTREGTFKVSPDGRPVLSPGDIAPENSGILFGRGWLPMERYIEQEPFRWAGQRAELLLEHPPAGASALIIELESGPGTGGAPLDLEIVGEGHQVLAHMTVDRRSRLRLPLQAPLPSRLWFRVHGGGAPTDRDARVLNFRAFRLEWERSASRGGSATLQPIRAHGRIASAWFAVQHVIDRLAKGGRLVTLTVPVTPRLRRYLKSYVDFRGFAGMVRHSVKYFRRRMSFYAIPAVGEDIFPASSGIAPGGGWRILEDFRAEAFRRVSDGAELIVSADAPDARELGLQVEPEHPLDLLLLDSSGKVIGEKRVSGLEFVRFMVPRMTGRTQIFRLGIRGEGLKVFWCGWVPKGSGTQTPARLSQPWGAGWRWNPDSGAMNANGPAELIVRTSARSAQPLYIDLETAVPTGFEVKDSTGRMLFAFHVSGRRVERLDVNLEPSRTHVLEISASAPFRAYACDWTENPGASAPVFIHTNACGDFTMMAREHWFDLRGYPEFDLFSMNLDSVLCSTAHFGGAREEMLTEPMRIYHIEHGTGSGWTPEGQAKLFERIAAKGIELVENEEVLAWAAQMQRLRSPMIFNHGNWGLADFDLKETVLSRDCREERAPST